MYELTLNPLPHMLSLDLTTRREPGEKDEYICKRKMLYLICIKNSVGNWAFPRYEQMLPFRTMFSIVVCYRGVEMHIYEVKG